MNSGILTFRLQQRKVKMILASYAHWRLTIMLAMQIRPLSS